MAKSAHEVVEEKLTVAAVAMWPGRPLVPNAAQPLIVGSAKTLRM
jgi:hypothetical protein